MAARTVFKLQSELHEHSERKICASVISTASFPGPRVFSYTKESHRAWYFKTSDQLTDVNIYFERQLLQFYKRLSFNSKSMTQTNREEKASYKKCRFDSFTCLRITSVLVHAHNYHSTTALSCCLRT